MLVIIVSSNVRTNIVYKLLYSYYSYMFSLKSVKKKLWIFPIVKDDNISPGRKYCYGKIYIRVHNNEWKFCGAHILIKCFFGCIKIYKKIPKKATRSWQPMNAFLSSFLRTSLMFVSYVCKELKMIFPWGSLVPTKKHIRKYCFIQIVT